MAVAVPDVAIDLGFLQAWHKPRASVEAGALTNENRVCRLVQLVLQRLKRRNRVGIEVHCPSGAVLSLRQINGATVEMNLSPGEGVLLREAHAGAD